MDPTNPESRVPQRIGRFTDLHVLGRGGMGAVYRAYDPELDRPVAIKVMLHSTPDFVARFRREAQAIARLTHGNVVQVFDFGVDDDGNPYFVMELVEGKPLDALLRDRGRLPTLEAVGIARQAAQGLVAAHRAGIIHRDVKPSNLIVDSHGTVKLVDFGIARSSTGQQLTTAASLMGTPGYMAPEQAQGKAVDHRADIYALGLTLFEMLAGEAPFQAEDPIALVVMNMNDPLPDLRRRDLGLPETLIALVEQMAKKPPDDRPQSCDAVIRGLDAIGDLAPTAPSARPVVADGDASSIPPTHVRPIETPAPSPRRGVGLAVAVALLVGGIGVTLVVKLVPKTKDAAKPVAVRPALPTSDTAQKAAGPSGDKVGDKVGTAEKAAEPSGDKPGDKAGAAIVPKADERAQPPPVETRTGPLHVAVFKFMNVGKDAALDKLSQGIGETLLSDMSGADPRMSLFERYDLESDIGELDRAKDVHFDKSTVAQSGNLQGVDVVLQGGFQTAGRKTRITARFVRVKTGEVLDTIRVDGRSRRLFDLQDQVSKELRPHLIALLDKERPKAEKDTPTP
jgi:serine/threonine-protein kinase